MHASPFYRGSMSRNRFGEILRFLRFDDCRTRSARCSLDKAAPIRDVWEMMNVSLKQNYCPSENLTVGEQLYPFRGRCDFRQYIPSKPAEYGLKVWWLCDSSNNYPLRSQIYCDKEGGTVDVNQGERVVKELVPDYKNTNRNITMDQFFTSYPLSMTLLKWKLSCLGILRSNKRCIPPALRGKREVQSRVYAFKGPVSLISYQCKVDENVTLLSTMHNDASESTFVLDERKLNKLKRQKAVFMSRPLKRPVKIREITLSESEKTITKPDILLDYNKTKCGVDTFDKMISNYTVNRRSTRWPMAMFFNLIDICNVALGIVYRTNNPEVYTGRSWQRDYLEALATKLAGSNQRSRVGNAKISSVPSTQHAFQALYPKVEMSETRSEKNVKQRCKICFKTGKTKADKDRKTKRVCVRCELPVCAVHSVRTFQCTYCATADA